MIGFFPFLRVLKARLMLIIWAFVICAGIAAAIGSVIPPRYKAETTLQVDSTTHDLLTGVMEPRQRVQEFLGQQAAVAGSRASALLAVEELVATNDLSLPAYEQVWQEKTGGELLPGNDLKLWIADELLRRVEITSDALMGTLTITYTAEDPAQAARYANALADAYTILITDQRRAGAARTARNFETESSAYKDQVEQSRQALTDFQQETGYVTIGTQQLEAAEVEHTSLTTRLAEARADDAEAQSLWQLTGNTPRSNLDTLPLPNTNVPGRTAQARLAVVKSQMQKLDERYGSQHPDYIEAQNETARLEQLIVSSVRERATFTTGRVAHLSDAVAVQKQRVLELQQNKQNYDVLEKDWRTAQQTYELITARSEQEGLQSRVDNVAVLLLARAVPPATASMPTFWVILLVGTIFGLGFGATMAVFVELMEGRVRASDSVAFATRQTVLAEINFAGPARRLLA